MSYKLTKKHVQCVNAHESILFQRILYIDTRVVKLNIKFQQALIDTPDRLRGWYITHRRAELKQEEIMLVENLDRVCSMLLEAIDEQMHLTCLYEEPTIKKLR